MPISNITDLMFSRVALTEVVRQLYKPNTFLRNFFFKKEKMFSTNDIMWDIYKGSRNRASLTEINAESKVLKRKGYKTKKTSIPHTKEKILMTVGELLNRALGGDIIVMPGDVLYRRFGTETRDCIETLIDRIVRLQEYLCSLAFTEGKIDIDNENITFKIDYEIPEENVLVADVAWQSNTADVIGDVQKLVRRVREISGVVPESLIVGHTAFSYMIKNKDFKETLDNLRIEMGGIKPEQLSEGASYCGRFPFPDAAIDIYQYTEVTIDDDGNNKYLIDPKKIFVGSKNAQNSYVWGRVSEIDSEADTKISVNSWRDFDPSGRWIKAESCSMPLLSQPDAFGRMTVVE